MTFILDESMYKYKPCQQMRQHQEVYKVGFIVEYIDDKFKLRKGKIFKIPEKRADEEEESDRWINIIDIVTAKPSVINIANDDTVPFICYENNSEFPPNFYELLRESMDPDTLPEQPKIDDDKMTKTYENIHLKDLLKIKTLSFYITIDQVKALQDNGKAQLERADRIIKDYGKDSRDKLDTKEFIKQFHQTRDDYRNLLQRLAKQKETSNPALRTLSTVIEVIEKANKLYQQSIENKIEKMRVIWTTKMDRIREGEEHERGQNGPWSRSRSYPSPTKVGNRENPSPSSCLVVFGLNITITKQDLEREFGRYGNIKSVQVIIDGLTKRSRGFAFIYFKSTDDAEKAKDNLNGIEIAGFKIRIEFSITKAAHKPTPGVYFHHRKATRPGFHLRNGCGVKRREDPYSRHNCDCYYDERDRCYYRGSPRQQDKHYYGYPQYSQDRERDNYYKERDTIIESYSTLSHQYRC